MKILSHISRTLRKAATAVLILFAGFIADHENRRDMTHEKDDTPELTELKRQFARSAMGESLLAYAIDHRVRIKFDSALIEKNNYGVYGDAGIRLQPGRAMEEMTSTLAHEIRHDWQDRNINYSWLESRTLTPSQQWVLRRYIEADAFTFAAYYYADRMKRLGISDKEARKTRNLTLLMAADMKKDMDKKRLTPSRYRTDYLAVRFSQLSTYKETHLPMAEKKATLLEATYNSAMKKYKRGDKKGADRGLDSLTRAFSKVVNVAAFEAYLRRFGAMGIGDDAPTPLADREKVTRHVLLNAYPRKLGGDEKENQAFRLKLDSLDARFYAVEKNADALRKKMQKRK